MSAAPVPPPAPPAADDDSMAGEEDPGAALEELGAAGLVKTPADSCAAENPATPAPDAAAAAAGAKVPPR